MSETAHQNTSRRDFLKSSGRIVAVGSDEEILPLATAKTSRHNLGGKFVIPGLTDMHSITVSNPLSRHLYTAA